jgi:CRISPR-associated endonuclease/helicase Cas3
LVETVLDHVGALTAQMSAGGPPPTAVVVCNTVDRARDVHTLLAKQLAARGATLEADCELLIGRSRPLDRPNLQDRILTRFGTGRAPASRTGILVATQTVEVGVNLDVDVLIRESASWDAVVQRLGRLNRLEQLPERFPGHDAAAAVIVHDG